VPNIPALTSKLWSERDDLFGSHAGGWNSAGTNNHPTNGVPVKTNQELSHVDLPALAKGPQSRKLGLVAIIATFGGLLFGFIGTTSAHLMVGVSSLLLPEGFLRATVILFFIVIFVAFMQGTIGPIVWLMLAEMFPLKVRGLGLGIAVFCLWITNFLISLAFPSFVASVGISGTFFVFAAWA
jgi:hypothetical protein